MIAFLGGLCVRRFVHVRFLICFIDRYSSPERYGCLYFQKDQRTYRTALPGWENAQVETWSCSNSSFKFLRGIFPRSAIHGAVRHLPLFMTPGGAREWKHQIWIVCSCTPVQVRRVNMRELCSAGGEHI
jgi:hypothetical protein